MSAAQKRSVVLVADDQADVLEAVRLLLKGEGFEIDTASSPNGILALIEKRDFDAILMDLNYTRDTTSGREGLDLLSRIRPPKLGTLIRQVVAKLSETFSTTGKMAIQQ